MVKQISCGSANTFIEYRTSKDSIDSISVFINESENIASISIRRISLKNQSYDLFDGFRSDAKNITIAEFRDALKKALEIMQKFVDEFDFTEYCKTID